MKLIQLESISRSRREILNLFRRIKMDRDPRVWSMGRVAGKACKATNVAKKGSSFDVKGYPR